MTDAATPEREWQKTRERNEALDCYVYARAVAAILGLDRMADRHWRQRAVSLGDPDPTPPEVPRAVEPPVPATPAEPAAAPPKRRTAYWPDRPDPKPGYFGRRSSRYYS